MIDEDWGWLVHAAREDDSVLGISIYHNPDDDPGREDDWALMVRVRKERAIGVFSRFREVPVGDAETAVVAGVFEEIDVPLRRTEGR